MTDKTMREVLIENAQHSIYVHCRACHKWGVNMPHDRVCGNCGDTENTTAYYPEESVKAIVESLIK